MVLKREMSRWSIAVVSVLAEPSGVDDFSEKMGITCGAVRRRKCNGQL